MEGEGGNDVIDHVDRQVSLDFLAAEAPGTGYVEAVEPNGSSTVVTLRYPFGTVDVVVPAVPSGDAAAHDRPKPFAVQVRVGACVECSVLESTKRGPQRVGVELEEALSLAADGVHTVFRS